MHRLVGTVLLILLALFTAPTSTQAQHFTFDVPVNVQRLPAKFTRVAVHCYVFMETPSRTEGLQLGYGSVDAALEGGSISRRFSVPVTVPAPRHPSEAVRWRCSLSALNSTNGNWDNLNIASDPGHFLFDPDLRRAPDAVVDIDFGGRL